jgi:hypothetical protein
MRKRGRVLASRILTSFVLSNLAFSAVPVVSAHAASPVYVWDSPFGNFTYHNSSSVISGTCNGTTDTQVVPATFNRSTGAIAGGMNSSVFCGAQGSEIVQKMAFQSPKSPRLAASGLHIVRADWWMAYDTRLTSHTTSGNRSFASLEIKVSLVFIDRTTGTVSASSGLVYSASASVSGNRSLATDVSEWISTPLTGAVVLTRGHVYSINLQIRIEAWAFNPGAGNNSETAQVVLGADGHDMVLRELVIR